MVATAKSPLYLLVGQDSISKNVTLARLKEEILSKKTSDFNFDQVYAKEINLKSLQEKFLAIPAASEKRLIVIKDAQSLKDDAKKFLLNYLKKPYSQIILVMDFEHMDRRDQFLSSLMRSAKVFRFKEDLPLDTFMLSRQISQGKCDSALKMLFLLLDKGEKPERILGGLRYSCLKNSYNKLELKKNLKLLLTCDIEIKTGKLKPVFALEKLIISLCAFRKSFS